MLPPATEDRVFAALPDSFPIVSEGQRYDWPLDKLWAHEDHDTETTDRPSVFVEPTLQGVVRKQDQPLTNVLGTAPSDGDTVSHYVIEGTRCYDEWTVTVADNGQYYGTTARDRVRYAAAFLKEWAQYSDSDSLYTSGPNGELPVLVSYLAEGGDVSDMIDSTLEKRRTFLIRLKYTHTRESAIDLVESVEVSFNSGPLRQFTRSPDV